MAETPSQPMPIDLGGDVGLTSLFELQDRALSHNFQHSRCVQDASTILARSVRLNLSILGAMRFGAEKQTAIRRFAVDTLSHIVVAARLGLWGASPESFSVLRGGVESCAQLAYSVAAQRYQTAILEGRKRFKQLAFEKVCGELGEDGRYLKAVHNRISNHASHSTAARFSQTEYRMGDEVYDRLGFAADPLVAEFALCDCIFPSRLVGESFERAFSQEGLPFSWTGDLEELAKVHKTFVEELLKERKREPDGNVPGNSTVND